MAGSLSISGSSLIDSHSVTPWWSIRSEAASKLGTTTLNMNQKTTNRLKKKTTSLSCHGWRGEVRALSRRRRPQLINKNRRGGIGIVSELGGQYEDSFEDVKSQLVNYFTYKAVSTVMNQLYEMNPTQYRWFYDFVLINRPGGDGKRFIRILAKERQDLAERVMITRLHLYGKWIKKCDHAEIYKQISDQNLELMRERLRETVIWPSSDDTTMD